MTGEELPVRARTGHKPLAGTTIALTDRCDALDLDHAVGEALNLTIRACEALGATLVQLPAPWMFEWDDLSEILMSEAWAYHQGFAARADRYRPALAEFIEIARNFTDAQRYIEAQTRRVHGTWMWEDRFRIHEVDLVLEPTLPIVPYERGPGYDRGHAGGPGDPLIALTSLWDMTGMPVAALPVSWEAGVSLIGPLGHEAEVLQAGLDLQEHALGVPGIAPAAGSAAAAA
jgi:aspartyl-tRNA(Asn)/glutamyl-tRNA(Gln) amidotransferase subunit A